MKPDQREDTDWREKLPLSPDQQYVFNRVVLALLLLTAGMLIGILLFGSNPEDNGYYTNLYTEVLSIGITVGIIEFFSQRRSKKEQQAREQEVRKIQQRIQQQQYEIRLRHLKTLEEKRLLLLEMDLLKLLEGADLSGMDLEGIDLGRLPPGTPMDSVFPKHWTEQPGRANLKGSRLHSTNFLRATLTSATFQGAYMLHTIFSASNLRYADLRDISAGWVSLENADLTGADLEGASFNRCSLSGANLRDANLRGADIYRTPITNVILPDGSRLQHSQDIARFVDPNHPQFWERSSNQWEWGRDRAGG